jgi:rhamnogalacturonan endolyase
MALRMKLMKTHRLTLLTTVIGFTLFALPGAPTIAAVELSENARSVTLTNQEVSIRFNQADGNLVSFMFQGRELLGPGKGYVQIAAAASYGPVQWAYRLCRREAGLVEIAFANTNAAYPFQVESHFVLRDGEPGFHNYLVLGHDAQKHPGTFALAQLDYCLRVDPKLFTVAAVDDGRIRAFPAPSLLTRDKMVMDATYRLPDGNYYSKYYHAAAMDETHTVHGVIGDGIGLWLVMPSQEHLNGGPEHQELTVHQTDTTPVLLGMFTAAHYGGGIIETDSTWSKSSTPWFVYVNTGASQDALWQDAKQRAAREVEAWPYAWFDNTPRGQARGRLIFDDGRPADAARVILVPHEDKPGPLLWQRRWQGYRFTGRCGDDGAFTLTKVRPGLYDLYAWRKGVLGAFARPGVRIDGNTTSDVGPLVWNLPRDRETLWQIGTADRSAAEFGYGDNFRQWGLWDKIAEAHPKGVAFMVGKNTERDLPLEMAVTQAKDFSWRLPAWQFQFVNSRKRTGKAMLTLALADAESNLTRRGPCLKVSMNGAELAQLQDFAVDGAAHRSGAFGTYQERQVAFDAARLREGTNTIALELLPPSKPVDRQLGYPGAAVMFDCLRLEVMK